jgi:hypothetical protein
VIDSVRRANARMGHCSGNACSDNVGNDIATSLGSCLSK